MLYRNTYSNLEVFRLGIDDTPLWCLKEVYRGNIAQRSDHLLIMVNDVVTKAYIGDWIVRDDKGVYSIIRNADQFNLDNVLEELSSKKIKPTPSIEPIIFTANEYQKAALRTADTNLNSTQRLLEGLMGLNGEAGECVDIYKKHLFQKHDMDNEHLAKELGDVAWYLALTADAIGYDLNTIFRMNIDKLKARYPEGFNSGLSINRKNNDV